MLMAVEGIRFGSVDAWFRGHVPGAEPPLRWTLIAGGHSNLTYAGIDARGKHYVLRRPPLGEVLASAHDMAREHRIVKALNSSGVPVAGVHGLCEDIAVNDAPFFVMDFVEGEVLHDAATAALTEPAQRQSLGHEVARVLGTLHQLDPVAVGLGNLGRHENYLERQIKRWRTQWELSRTEEVPAMEETARRLLLHLPLQQRVSIVHGDYRLGNMIVGAGHIRAVLDWELCTLGDPLADLGYLLNTWLMPQDRVGDVDDHMPTTAGEFPDGELLVKRYAADTGLDLSTLPYYRAFSHWRIAAIRQGVYKRYLMGAMGSQREFDLAGYRQSILRKAELALSLLS
jgi:aminoglycoside phosphotransferase (APT) family kinase protein